MVGKIREFILIRSRNQNDDQPNRSLGRLYVRLLGLGLVPVSVSLEHRKAKRTGLSAILTRNLGGAACGHLRAGEYQAPSFFFSSRRRHTRWPRDWSSDVCSSDLNEKIGHKHHTVCC